MQALLAGYQPYTGAIASIRRGSLVATDTGLATPFGLHNAEPRGRLFIGPNVEVYAGMVGIGFAFTENILYLASAYMGEEGQAGGFGGAVGLFIVRCVFGPFAHPFFTAFTGIGIGIAVGARSRSVRVVAPIVGYAVAVVAHAS